ncbi:hypothetical protein BSZ39_00125 [Bowdeniella nasicola]|uniref:YlxR domain-containing protein n=1 Tax=Bowdeniella nasicola TaxID=208480 RepID=A0A1Q5Q5P3_9ACTO|nr:hypothetical protein BSZ39_00125 [Bowdeniella nasicola]
MSDVVHVPERTCVGCRTRAPRDQLIRFVLREGRACYDPQAAASGRGAWLHPDETCRQAALRNRGMSRAFRTQVLAIDEITQ